MGSKILPALFNTDMVLALLENRKTVTRRLVKYSAVNVYRAACANGLWYETYKPDDPPEYLVRWYIKNVAKPPYRPGDILYVRETWNGIRFGNGNKVPFHTEYWYKADDTSKNPDDKWRPSIHMPKEAARIFLLVKSVRVEPLGNITVDGALREGTPDVEPPPICQKDITYPESFPKGFDGWDEARREEWIKSTARARYIGWCDYADRILKKFGTIWDGTIKPSDLALYGWAANPWVWVIEFERCKRPDGWPTTKT